MHVLVKDIPDGWRFKLQLQPAASGLCGDLRYSFFFFIFIYDDKEQKIETLLLSYQENHTDHLVENNHYMEINNAMPIFGVLVKKKQHELVYLSVSNIHLYEWDSVHVWCLILNSLNEKRCPRTETIIWFWLISLISQSLNLPVSK